MDLIDELKTLASKVLKQKDSLQTEEATKNAFVMPFIKALGYNVFDPDELTPELTADIGTKKGEKVDYAILQEGKPIILFECKWCGVNLDKQEHKSQLYRYFSVTEARFAVLTNGIIYRFYTDIEDANKMDSKAFMEFNLLNITEQSVEDLKKFSKSFFNVTDTLTAASELKYTREIKLILAEQLVKPTDEMVKLFASKIYSGKVTQSVREQFSTLVRSAFHQFINEKINDRLKYALLTEESHPSESDLLESLQNGTLSPLEEAKSYQVLLDKGHTVEELAKKLRFKQVSRITERTHLLNLKPEYQAMIGKGLTNSQASEMARLPKNKQDVLFKQIKTGDLDTDNKLREQVNELLASTPQKMTREERIVTTPEEIEGHKIVQDILKELAEPKRVVMRDTISYCGILFDDNNRKPICRLYFNNLKRKQLALLDEQKNEEKVPINELDDIRQYADKLKFSVMYYLSNAK
jgi:predicted type IV restriction endonuclease